MSYIRKVRLEYYEIVCKKKEDTEDIPDRIFDLNLWIDKVGRMSLEARTFDYYQEQARLDKFWHDPLNDKWFLNFLRLRETNIPTTAKVDEEAEPIILEDDEFIGEDANALYDDKLNVLMLQRNRYSLGVKGIEEYLNLVWNTDEETIYLRPICPIDIQERARRAHEYRKITIRFADAKGKTLTTDQRKPFRKMFDNLKKYEGVNAEITITMGYNRNESLNKETVKDTIDEIMDNKEIITKAELSVKDVEDSAVEVIDLFADKMHDFIFLNLERRESLASEYVAFHMNEKYNEARGKLIESLRVRSDEE